MMKFAIALLALSTTVMVVMVGQAIRQELNLRSLKNRMVQNREEVGRKEEAIAEIKNKVTELKAVLDAATGKLEELKTQRGKLEISKRDYEAKLKICTEIKEAATQNKTSVEEAIKTLTDGHKKDEEKSMGEIKALKQQILDRDKAVCAFADTTKEEARKLCGM